MADRETSFYHSWLPLSARRPSSIGPHNSDICQSKNTFLGHSIAQYKIATTTIYLLLHFSVKHMHGDVTADANVSLLVTLAAIMGNL